MNKHYNINLPQWPAMVVVGENVTKDQAKEILIRTDSLSFFSNDKEFEMDLNEALFGVRAPWNSLEKEISKMLGFDEINWLKVNEYWETIYSKYKRIHPISYLANNRIVSSWIGGPHGWCDWNGNIGTSNYNIGKYPSVEEVHNEWKMIAKAFPFLDLKCQLFSGETSEDYIIPVVQFNIKNGKVKITVPKKVIDRPTSFPIDISSIFLINNKNRERGCSIETFKDALNFTEKFTGFHDDNGEPILIGDKLRSENGYDLIVTKEDDGDYSGKLVCKETHSCKDIPYSINDGSGHIKII